MANVPIQQFYVNGWRGGWQPDLPQTQLQPDMIPTLLNVIFGEGYAVAKRGGYRKVTDDVTLMDTAGMCFPQRVFTSTGEHPNFTQRVMYFNENNYDLYVQTFGQLLKDDLVAGTGADFVDTGHSMGQHPIPSAVNYFRCWSLQCITYGSNIYVTGLRFDGNSSNGTVPETDDGTTGSSAPSKPIKYDVQAGTYSRPSVHSLAGGTTGFPAARACIVKYDRVFAGNLYKKGVYRYPSRFYWSDAGTTETYGATSYIEVGGDDGSEITSMLDFGEQILIFKNTSVWSLVGSDEDTFALYNLDHNLGCEATFGSYSSAGKAYFFDYRNGVWEYDGANFTNISKPVNNFMLDNINRDAAFKAVLYVHDERLFVSLPIGEFAFDTSDHATRTFMYDIRLGVWTQWDIGFVPIPDEYYTDYNVLGVGVSSDGRFYAAGLDDKVGLFKLEENGDYSDGGSHGDTATAYNAHFSTNWWNPGNTGDAHRIRRLEALVDASSAPFEVDVFRDLSVNQIWSTATVTTISTYDEWHEIQPARDIGLWTWLKFKFYNADINEFFEVHGAGMMVSDRKRPRGPRQQASSGGGGCC